MKTSKKCILVGGLPFSGKTTLAKEEYSDYFLVDDPRNFVDDVCPHSDEPKLIITDPHLSNKSNRLTAIESLIDLGYEVEVILLDVDKEVLLQRWEDSGRSRDVENFIRHYYIEK